MDKDRTTSVYRYALAVAAGEDDPLCRQLGPIHLLKYAYLVDLEHAKHHAGGTFTGIDWTFHSFGPWSSAAHALIAVAVAFVGIRERRIASDYGREDVLRWSMDTELVRRMDCGRDLPLEVRGTLDCYVHKFGADTSGLLHYVYTTVPILRAAPGNPLDFSPAPVPAAVTESGAFVPLMSRLPKKKKDAFRARMDVLREAFEHRRAATAKTVSFLRRRVDAEFAETAEWVNSLAGPEFSDGEVTVDFDDSVWRSEARQGHAVS